MKTIQMVITGRVQKVGFRACVRRIATDLRVTGTVSNLPNGKVQVFATGDAIILEKFVSTIYGCPRAIIRDIRIDEISPNTFDDFSIIKSEGRISTEF